MIHRARVTHPMAPPAIWFFEDDLGAPFEWSWYDEDDEAGPMNCHNTGRHLSVRDAIRALQDDAWENGCEIEWTSGGWWYNVDPEEIALRASGVIDETGEFVGNRRPSAERRGGPKFRGGRKARLACNNKFKRTLVPFRKPDGPKQLSGRYEDLFRKS